MTPLHVAESINRLLKKHELGVRHHAASLDIPLDDIRHVLGYIEALQDRVVRPPVASTAQRYVLGLLFNRDLSSVVLIEKRTPEWQAGLLNGVGGKVEPGENERGAMVREFKEETGADTTPLQWLSFCEMSGDDFVVECFMSVDETAHNKAISTEDELVTLMHVGLMHNFKCVPHLHWLIQMALDVHTGKRFFSTVRYSEPFRLL